MSLTTSAISKAITASMALVNDWSLLKLTSPGLIWLCILYFNTKIGRIPLYVKGCHKVNIYFAQIVFFLISIYDPFAWYWGHLSSKLWRCELFFFKCTLRALWWCNYLSALACSFYNVSSEEDIWKHHDILIVFKINDI